MSTARLNSAAACIAAAATTATLSLFAQRAAAQQGPDLDDAKVSLGKATYPEKCSHCHGPNMINSGTITPDLRRFSGDRERFFNTVKLGKNNRMPPWGDLLNDEQIGSLWAYVSSQRKP